MKRRIVRFKILRNKNPIFELRVRYNVYILYRYRQLFIFYLVFRVVILIRIVLILIHSILAYVIHIHFPPDRMSDPARNFRISSTVTSSEWKRKKRKMKNTHHSGKNRFISLEIRMTIIIIVMMYNTLSAIRSFSLLPNVIAPSERYCAGNLGRPSDPNHMSRARLCASCNGSRNAPSLIGLPRQRRDDTRSDENDTVMWRAPH